MNELHAAQRDVKEPEELPNVLPLRNYSKRVLVIGDLILDRYVYGTCDRVAPDFSVPILVQTHVDHKLGGAGNVVNNLTELGLNVDFITILGNSDKEIINLLDNHGISLKYCVKSREFHVKTICRYISGQHHHLRVDTNVDSVISQTDMKSLQNQVAHALKETHYDAIILSDYRNGILTKEFAQCVIQKAQSKSVRIFVDPKRGEYDRFSGATYIKPNKEDVLYLLRDSTFKQSKKKVCAEFCNRCVISVCILTLAEEGVAWYSQNDQCYGEYTPKNKCQVKDVCGAGDTFLSALVFSIVNNWSLEQAVKFSCRSAASVITKPGTAVVKMIDILDQKVITSKDELKILKAIIPKEKTIVLTTGCFDVLHVGYIDSLQQAKELGDRREGITSIDRGQTGVKGIRVKKMMDWEWGSR